MLCLFFNFSLTNRWSKPRRWNVSGSVTPSENQQRAPAVWWLDGGKQTTFPSKCQMSWSLSMWLWSTESSATLLNITALSLLSPAAWYVPVQTVKTVLIPVRWECFVQEVNSLSPTYHQFHCYVVPTNDMSCVYSLSRGIQEVHCCAMEH